ncbi:MAG TPA: hypothetical protein VGM82_15315 [Gemmatimonadaceae bacterium]|jgi:hypothetical protein
MLRKVVALLFLAAVPALAQFPRSRNSAYKGPDYWVGLSYGFVDATTIFDGTTNTEWRLGYAPQLRATLEKTLQRGITAGISAGYATQPLTYTSSTFNTSDCAASCNAKADVTQYMAFIQGGASTGFHILYNIEGGMTQYSNFRTEDTDAKLPPDKGGYDFSFGLGGGVGYGLSASSDLYVEEVVDFILHPQGSSSSSSVPRLPSFRAGFRIGF